MRLFRDNTSYKGFRLLRSFLKWLGLKTITTYETDFGTFEVIE